MTALLLDDEAEGLEAALSLLDEYDELTALYSSHSSTSAVHATTISKDDAPYTNLRAAFHISNNNNCISSHHRALSAISSRSSSTYSSSDSGHNDGGGSPDYFDPTASGQPSGGTTTSASTGAGLTAEEEKQKQTAAAKSRKRPIGFNSNHARDERRKELIYLRQKVDELETQLGQLQRPNAEVSSTNLRLLPPSQQNALQQLSINTWSQHGLTRAPDAGASSLSKESSVWKELATRQHAEREKAEMENIRLKLILEEQIKIAKNLHTMLTKKTTAKVRSLARYMFLYLFIYLTI